MKVFWPICVVNQNNFNFELIHALVCGIRLQKVMDRFGQQTNSVAKLLSHPGLDTVS